MSTVDAIVQHLPPTTIMENLSMEGTSDSTTSNPLAHRFANQGDNQSLLTRAVPISKKLLGFGLDPSADDIDSVIVHDLHWWTNDQDLANLCSQIGIEVEVRDVHFSEHKVNGKSKGQAVIDCHSKENALRLNDHLQLYTFQGKKVPSALASSASGNPLHPGNQDFPVVRPLSTAIHSTVRHPTNSHGGVNFNRVRPNSRPAIHANLGMGHPPAGPRTFSMGNFNPQQTGLMPNDPAIAWSSQQGDYPTFALAPRVHGHPFPGNGQEYGMLPTVS